jgi:arsenite/tail-anchored protein-transporting ATPase
VQPAPSLALDARWLFVGGKGGVGKTTVAAALAVSLARADRTVLALSIDPAHSLGDALGLTLGTEPSDVPDSPGLRALELDAAAEQRRFVETHREAILELAEGGTYLDREDLDGFLQLALPGVDELAAVLRLLRPREPAPARVVIDTAPTGHTLRLLALPRQLRAWIDALAAMQEKRRQVSQALVGAFRPGAGGDFLSGLAHDLDRIEALLRDPSHTRFLLVTNPEPAVAAESHRFLAELRALGVPLAGVALNRDEGSATAFDAGSGVPVVRLGRTRTELVGVEPLRAFARPLLGELHADAAIPRRTTSAAAGAAGAGYFPPVGRRLYLVGGKGGVGKTTVSAAIALGLSARGAGRVLLLSVDPAGSLDEVLGDRAEAASVAGAPGVEPRQLDAGAVWSRFRAEYAESVERLFTQLMGSMSAHADAEVMRRLVDLAPPGLDEVMALGEVIDALEAGVYNALVLDTAPTGHLLRLLEMPETGLAWTHALMRLLLKYRQVVRTGGLGERLLGLARSLRWISALLRDASRACVVVVALPESLSVPETRRLLARLAALSLPVDALLVNRVAPGSDSADLAALAAVAGVGPAALVAAPERGRGPSGAGELLDFAGSWRHTSPDPSRP